MEIKIVNISRNETPKEPVVKKNLGPFEHFALFNIPVQ